MYFKDIIGQEDVKERLLRMAAAGHLPHALLLDGMEGCGALPLAIALARWLCCTGEKGTDACGHCPSCVQFNKLAHPDLHFVFPIYKPSSGKTYYCDDFLEDWRSFLLKNPYFSFNDWMTHLTPNNAQGMIYADEGSEILRKLSLKSYEADCKIMIVWLPEKMHPNCANRLLKILEEPPENTFFFLVTENREQVLGTIDSRSQHIHVPGIDSRTLANALRLPYPSLSETDADTYARLSKGSWTRACESVQAKDESSEMLRQFIRCMRGAYTIAHFSAAKNFEKQEALCDLKLWADEMAKTGREPQKQFLEYSQRLLRENFIMNLREPQLNYLNDSEQAFSSRFFPFINENNVEGFMKEFELAQNHIAQNVNARMVFFDLALQAILLFK